MITKMAFFIALLGMLALVVQVPQNNDTTICLDGSMPMAERNLEKDLWVLEKVFERNKDQEVELLIFGIGLEEKKYTVKDGAWQQLRTDLFEGDHLFQLR